MKVNNVFNRIMKLRQENTKLVQTINLLESEFQKSIQFINFKEKKVNGIKEILDKKNSEKKDDFDEGSFNIETINSRIESLTSKKTQLEDQLKVDFSSLKKIENQIKEETSKFDLQIEQKMKVKDLTKTIQIEKSKIRTKLTIVRGGLRKNFNLVPSTKQSQALLQTESNFQKKNERRKINLSISQKSIKSMNKEAHKGFLKSTQALKGQIPKEFQENSLQKENKTEMKMNQSEILLPSNENEFENQFQPNENLHQTLKKKEIEEDIEYNEDFDNESQNNHSNGENQTTILKEEPLKFKFKLPF